MAAAVKFPTFDVVPDVADHHFGRRHVETSMPVRKKIMQELKSLVKELPDTIYVRTYETRVDLLRVAIVGAPGTPYHDGLFFFDVAFPSDYPNHPPAVHYQSFGFRVNPNLYHSGHVCLSLLGSWPGRDRCENWDPKTSNLLQILLSIQALVLNERPFFNEPAYALSSVDPQFEKASLAYNENAFVLNCKTMLCVLRCPPKHFELLVYEHFKDRGDSILGACDAYRKGLVKVGLFDGVVKDGKGEVSRKFKVQLDHTYGRLEVAFARIKAAGDLPEYLMRCEQAIEEEKAAAAAAAEKAAAAAEKAAAAAAEALAAAAAKEERVIAEVCEYVAKNCRKVFDGLLMKMNNQMSKTSPVLVVPQAAEFLRCGQKAELPLNSRLLNKCKGE